LSLDFLMKPKLEVDMVAIESVATLAMVEAVTILAATLDLAMVGLADKT